MSEVNGDIMSELVTKQDHDAEFVLRYMEVQWKVEDIRLDGVDWNASSGNCARIYSAFNEEKIADYRMAMQAGDVFPMPVLERMPTGLVILGGNQRLAAAKQINPAMSLKAYVVADLTERETDVITRSLNSRHGWASPKEERVANAAYMVKVHGMSTRDACRLLNVSDASIRELIRADEVRVVLQEKGGIDTTLIPQNALATMARMADNREVVALGKCIVEHKPPGKDVQSFVTGLLGVKSTAERMKRIKTYEKELIDARAFDVRKPEVAKRPRRRELFRMMESMAKFLDTQNNGEGFTTLQQLQCTPIDNDRLTLLAKRIMFRFELLGIGHNEKR